MTFTVEVVVAAALGFVVVVAAAFLAVVLVELPDGWWPSFGAVEVVVDAAALAVVAVVPVGLAVVAVVAVASARGGWVPGGPAQAGNPLITITSPAAAMAPPARLRRSIPKPPRRELRGIRSGRGPAPRSMSAGCPVPPGVGHVRGAPPAYGLP